MPRSMSGLTPLWVGLTVLTLCGTASAQWYSGGSNCGCSSPTYAGPPPIMRQSAAFFGAAPAMPASYASSAAYSSAAYGGDLVECGQPINCHIEQPAVVHTQAIAVPPPVTHTVVAVQQLQPVHQAIMQDVKTTEFQPVKRMVSKPVVTTEYIDQPVTVMTPVTESRVANVPTVNYQTVTEYKTVQKQVGYWVTKNVPTNKVSPWQYDNRPNAMGAMNRASYTMRTAFTPQYQQVRTFVPQTMTCTVPCKRQVAVQGMHQVTYNTTRMQPTQTTRKVAVNRTTYTQEEVTVMAPVQVVKTMQVGTRVSYAHPATLGLGTNPTSGGTALSPTPDAKASAAQPKPARSADNGGMDANKINNRGASLEQIDPNGQQLGESTVPARDINVQAIETNVPAKKFTATNKPSLTPTAVRVSQWVARTTPARNSPSNPQPGGKSTAVSIADTTR